jgi:hypothetical protein
MYPRAPLPLQTFVGAKTAIHLSRDPSYSQMTIIEAAVKFNLPDLQGALTDYINRSTARGTYTIGGHCSIKNMTLLHEDTKVEVWNKAQLQNYAYHMPHDICPAQTINISSPSTVWSTGHGDVVLVNTDSAFVWPQSGMKGENLLVY